MKWTKEEKKILVAELASGINLITIAKNHKRSVSDINKRIKKIIISALKKGDSVNDISRVLKLDRKYIESIYAKYKHNKQLNKHGGSLNIEQLKEQLQAQIKILKVENAILRKIARDTK